jgi:CemA family
MSREEEVLRKFRTSRAKTAMAVQFLLTLILVPLLMQQVSKHLIVRPLVDRLSGDDAAQVFLNSEMKEEAFKELQFYEEGLKFDALIQVKGEAAKSEKSAESAVESPERPIEKSEKLTAPTTGKREKLEKSSEPTAEKSSEPTAENPEKSAAEAENTMSLAAEAREKLVQEKAIEIAEQFRGKSRDAVSNVFADMIATAVFVLIALMNRTQITILKSFMDDVV